MSARPPAVLVGIDTEADDQWSAAGPRRRSASATRSACPRCRRCSTSSACGRPTSSPTRWPRGRRARSVLRDLARTGRCEIGTHLHPWTSPPFRPEDLAAHTYPHNLPAGAARPPAPRADRGDRGEPRACGPRPTAPGATASTGARCPSWSGSATPSTPASIRSSTSGARAGWSSPALRSFPTTPTTRTCGGRARRRSWRSRSRSATAARRCPRRWRAAYARAAAHPLARRAQAPGPAAGVAAALLHAARGHAGLRRSRLAARRRAVLQHHLPLQRAAARRQPLHAGRSERRALPRRPARACSST